MATSSNRDVTLGVEIQTAGEESLTRLATEVRSLAKAGGDAGPQFLQLADTIDRLAAEAKALAEFKAAAAALDETTKAARVAAVEADRLNTQFTEQSAAAAAARSEQAQLQAQLDKTQKALAEQRQQLDLLKASQKAGKVDADQYAASQAKIAEATAALKKQAADLGIDLRAAKAATAEAAAGLDKLGESAARAGAAAERLQRSVQAQTAEFQTARAAGEAFSADFTDVAAAQERLNSAFKDSAGAVAAIAAAQKLAEEERKTAAAVQALTDDIDKQAATVRGKLVASLSEAAAAYEREQAAQRKAAEAEAAAAAALRAKAEAADLARREAEALAFATEQSRLAVQSELAALAESEAFIRRYADAKQRAATEALQFVLAEEQSAAAAEKASRRIAELNAMAERTQRADQYVRELAAAFDAAEKQAAEAAAQVQRLQGYFDKLGQQRDIVKSAFGATGLRSIQDIEQEMFKVQRALVTLQAEFSAGRISIADFERASAGAATRLRTLKTEIETIPGDRSVFNQLAEGANNLITKFGALTAALATVGFAVKPVLDEFIKLEATTRILTQVTGSSAEAARQIEFLRNVAQQSGQAFGEVSQSYAKFAASALQAGLSTEQVQAAFKAVAIASGNLGLSSDQAKRALEALGQMASKGTVSMEELRQQLGDALPGILPALAKQLGLTTGELNKLVESGGLLANDAIPALTNALNQMANTGKPVEGLVASWNRFRNIVMEAGVAIMDGPLGKAAGYLTGAFAGAIRDVTVVAYGFSEALNVVGRTFGLVAAALSGGIKDFGQFKTELDAILIDSGKRLDDFKARAYGAGEAVTQAGQAAAQAAPATQQLGAATQQAGQAAQAAAGQHQQHATAVTQSGQAAAGASTLLAKLRVDYEEVITAVENRVKIASTELKAAKEQADATRALAELAGDEAVAKNAAAAAAQRVAVAAQEEAERKRTLVAVMQAQRDALELQARAEGKLDEERKKQLATLDEKIAKERAGADEARAAAAAERQRAEAAALAAETQRNNTARIAEYADALKKARAELAQATAANDGSAAAQQRVADAATAAAKAQGRYNDSLKDAAAIGIDVREIQTGVSDAFFNTAGALNGTITSLREMGMTAEQAGPQMAAALDKQIEAAKTRQELEFVRAEVVRAREAYLLLGGDAERALERIRAKTAELSPALQQAQKDAALLGVTLKQGTGESAQAGVTAALGAYERLKAGGKASTDELQQAFANLANRAIVAAGGIVPEWVKVEAAARGVRLETDAVGNTVAKVSKQGRDDLYQLAKGFDSVAEATRKADDAALRYGSTLKQNRYDAEGYALGEDGQRFTAGGQLDIPDGYFFDVEAANRSPMFRAGRTDGSEFIKPKPETLAAQAAADAADLAARGGAQFNGGRGTPRLGPTGSTPSAASSTHYVTINLAGRTTQVAVATSADGETLAALLKQIEADAMRAGG